MIVINKRTSRFRVKLWKGLGPNTNRKEQP